MRCSLRSSRRFLHCARPPASREACHHAKYTEFVRFSLLPVRRLGEESFDGALARRLVAGSALHADLPPEAPLSGFFGWLLCSLGQGVGFPVPEGGASALTTALVRRLERLGGHVHCNMPVTDVIVRSNRAIAVRTSDGNEVEGTRAVIADVSAPALYRTLLQEHDLPAGFRRNLDRFQWDNATVKIDWTLDGPIPWSVEAARTAGTVHLVESVDALTRTSAELACGEMPTKPFLIVGQQSMTDPTRQPAGKETAWAYTHVPHPERSDVATDAHTIATLVDRMETTIEEHAPGFRGLVRGRHVLTPCSFEAENANLVGGAPAAAPPSSTNNWCSGRSRDSAARRHPSRDCSSRPRRPTRAAGYTAGPAPTRRRERPCSTTDSAVCAVGSDRRQSCVTTSISQA